MCNAVAYSGYGYRDRTLVYFIDYMVKWFTLIFFSVFEKINVPVGQGHPSSVCVNCVCIAYNVNRVCVCVCEHDMRITVSRRMETAAAAPAVATVTNRNE